MRFYNKKKTDTGRGKSALKSDKRKEGYVVDIVRCKSDDVTTGGFHRSSF